MQRSQVPNASTQQRLLSDEQYRELLQKAVTEVLSFSRPPAGTYSSERDAALNLLSGLLQFGAEVNSVSGGGEAALRKKLLELNPEGSNGLQYQNLINNNSSDAALEGIEKAPKDQREQLYLQLATRESSNGDTARARQIVNDRVTNPYQRRQARRQYRSAGDVPRGFQRQS